MGIFNFQIESESKSFTLMWHKLHELVPSFTLHLKVENAPNPGRKHFEKPNIMF